MLVRTNIRRLDQRSPASLMPGTSAPVGIEARWSEVGLRRWCRCWAARPLSGHRSLGRALEAPVLEPPGISSVLTGTPSLPGPETFPLCEMQDHQNAPLWARALWNGVRAADGASRRGFALTADAWSCALLRRPLELPALGTQDTAEAAAWAGRVWSAGVFGAAVRALGSSGRRPPAVGCVEAVGSGRWEQNSE